MSAPNLTSADFGSNSKFAAIQSQITPTVLGYINRSERLKELIHAYQGDNKAADVIVDSAKPKEAIYEQPRVRDDGSVVQGTATFGTDTINTLSRLIETLSHELGHYDVENPGKVIANARAAAAAAGDAQARRDAANDYDAACHLTEGYARLDTARIIDEIVANGGLSSTDGNWPRGEDKAYKEYKEYKALE